MPWRYKGDIEFLNRVDKFIIVHKVNLIVLKKRIYMILILVSQKNK